MMKKIVLFDMDGTLTPARKKMEYSVLSALKKLQDLDFEIGIVTGSGMDYIKEQCVVMFDDFNFDHNKVYYFPYNGTKYIRFDTNKEKVLYEM
jgi:hydroxymethylpyrimidine pyrophosphatase-like HAD family hydrolase